MVITTTNIFIYLLKKYKSHHLHNCFHFKKITKEVFKADISFTNGASVNIVDTKGLTYTVKFYDHKTNQLIWQDNISDGF